MTYVSQASSITIYGASTNTTLEAQTRDGHVELEMIGIFGGERIWMDITPKNWRVLREEIDRLLAPVPAEQQSVRVQRGCESAQSRGEHGCVKQANEQRHD
jgi:hypothetical protein